MSRSAPSDVYLDTDVLVNLVYPELPHADACARAGRNLYDAGSTVYISALTRVEFAQAFRSMATQGSASSHLIREFDLARWREAGIRQRWLEYWHEELELLLGSFPQLIELPITTGNAQRSVTLMARYALRSQDAVHLSTALHYNVPVFWTCDDHFARVDELAVDILRASH